MGGLGVKFQHFPLTLLVVLTTLTLPCERDYGVSPLNYVRSYSFVPTLSPNPGDFTDFYYL